MSRNLSVPISLVESFFFAAKRRGFDLDPIFSDVGLDYKQFLRDLAENPLQRMDLDYVDPLFHSLWAKLGDEASGFVERPLRNGTFSMMCHSIITAKSLRHALLRGSKFIGLFGDELAINLFESDDEAHLDIQFENRLAFDEVFLITSLFIIWIRLSCWLIERPILLERIEFRFEKPIFSEEYALMFPCRSEFSQARNRVVFKRKYLDLPVVQNEATLVPFLQNAPGSLLTQFRSDDSITAQVKRILLNRKEGSSEIENLSFDLVASELHMTTHTVRRRLKDEGSSYKEIKDSVRRDQAVKLLNKSHLSINDVAHQLGFSEAAAFNRAFKKWTGITPGAYRDQLST
jgi:AraC-like DNA-binding protein